MPPRKTTKKVVEENVVPNTGVEVGGGHAHETKGKRKAVKDEDDDDGATTTTTTTTVRKSSSKKPALKMSVPPPPVAVVAPTTTKTKATTKSKTSKKASKTAEVEEEVEQDDDNARQQEEETTTPVVIPNNVNRSVETLRILDQAQRGTMSVERLTLQMRKLWLADAAKVEATFNDALDRVLLEYRREPGVERVVELMASFLEAINSESASSEATTAEDTAIVAVVERRMKAKAFLEDLLRKMCSRAGAKDKAVRLRCVQMIGLLLRLVPSDPDEEEAFFVDETIWDTLERTLCQRARDKIPGIRTEAIRSMGRLQQPPPPEEEDAEQREETDECTKEILRAMRQDPSKQVRLITLSTIIASPRAIESMIERIRDVNEEVRARAFVEIGKKIPLKSLTLPQRLSLVDEGLRDSSERVVKACGESLILKAWYERDCRGSLVTLARCFDALHHHNVPGVTVGGDEGEEGYATREAIMVSALDCVIRKLTASGGNSVESILSQARVLSHDNNVSKEEEDEPHMAAVNLFMKSPETAAVLSTICLAMPARAGEVVPDVVTVCDIISATFEMAISTSPTTEMEATDGEQGAGKKRRDVAAFVLRHLARVVKAMDVPSEDSVTKSTTMSCLLNLAFSPRLSLLTTSQEEFKQDWIHPEENLVEVLISTALLAIDGDEASVTRRIVEEISNLRDPLETAELRQKLKVLVEELDALKREKRELVEREEFEAAAALKKRERELEASVREAREAMGEETSAGADWKAVRSVCVARALLRHTRVGMRSPELRGLFESVILPALQSPEEPIRGVAVDCMGLYSLLDESTAHTHGGPLTRLFLEDASDQVKARALHSLFDILATFGMERLVGNESEEDAEQEMEALLVALTGMLQHSDRAVSLAVIRGFAEALFLGRLEDARIVQCLMILLFHPSTESDPLARQILSVFFSLFSPAHGETILRMAEPMIDALVAPAQGSMCEDLPMDAVLSHLAYSVCAIPEEEEEEEETVEAKKARRVRAMTLASVLCRRALAPNTPRSAQQSLIRCLVNLPLECGECDLVEEKRLWLLASRASLDVVPVACAKVLAKAFDSFLASSFPRRESEEFKRCVVG